jgi:uncharacterized small protein (DUF1192 family)
MSDASVNDPCECGQTTIRGCADMPSRHCGATRQTAQPVTDINALIAEMRAGLEGVTPGPWAYVPDHFSDGSIKRRSVCVERSKYDWIDLISDLNNASDAAHIARCNPANIAALLDKIERLRADNARLRDAVDESYSTLAAAFNRIHGLPRTSDTELADRIEATRAKIERAREAMEASNGNQ